VSWWKLSRVTFWWGGSLCSGFPALYNRRRNLEDLRIGTRTAHRIRVPLFVADIAGITFIGANAAGAHGD